MEATILAPHPLRDIRWMLGLALTLALLAGLAVPARAYRDQNGNRIDRITLCVDVWNSVTAIWTPVPSVNPSRLFNGILPTTNPSVTNTCLLPAFLPS